MADAIGAGRVGLRLNPGNTYNDTADEDSAATHAELMRQAAPLGLAYLHVMRADFFGLQKADVMAVARDKYKGVLIGNMGYTPKEAEQAIAEGKLDAVAFGTSFLANPDLPARIQAGAALNAPDASTFYTPGAKGYTDYPTM